MSDRNRSYMARNGRQLRPQQPQQRQVQRSMQGSWRQSRQPPSPPSTLPNPNRLSAPDDGEPLKDLFDTQKLPQLLEKFKRRQIMDAQISMMFEFENKMNTIIMAEIGAMQRRLSWDPSIESIGSIIRNLMDADNIRQILPTFMSMLDAVIVISRHYGRKQKREEQRKEMRQKLQDAMVKFGNSAISVSNLRSLIMAIIRNQYPASIRENPDYGEALWLRVQYESKEFTQKFTEWLHAHMPLYDPVPLSVFGKYITEPVQRNFVLLQVIVNNNSLSPEEKGEKVAHMRNELLKTAFICLYAIGVQNFERYGGKIDMIIGLLTEEGSLYRTSVRHSTIADQQWRLLPHTEIEQRRRQAAESSTNCSPFAQLYGSILRSVTLGDDGNLRARHNIAANEIIFREPVVAIVKAPVSVCTQCKAMIGTNFVPCDQCTRSTFCNDICASMSRMPVVGRHRDATACADSTENPGLSRYGHMLWQMVQAVGGPQTFKQMVFKRRSDKSSEQSYEIRNWKHVTEDFNIFAIAAIFGRWDKRVTPQQKLAPQSEVRFLSQLHKLRFIEAINLAKTLFGDTSPRMIERLYVMLMQLVQSPQTEFVAVTIGDAKRQPTWMKAKSRKIQTNPSILYSKYRYGNYLNIDEYGKEDEQINQREERSPNQVIAIGAFGGAFIRSYSCKPNACRRFNAKIGVLEYIALRPIKQGELLSHGWNMGFLPKFKPGHEVREFLIGSYYRLKCDCPPCVAGRNNREIRFPQSGMSPSEAAQSPSSFEQPSPQ